QAVLSQTAAVVLARFEVDDKGNSFLHIHEVVHDPDSLVNNKVLQVGHSGLYEGVDVEDGVQAAFFLSSTNRLVFVAEPPSATSVERLREVPLELRGFYSFNAHLVQPAVVSLKSIEGAFKSGVFRDEVEVFVAFPDKSGPVASELPFRFRVENGGTTKILTVPEGLDRSKVSGSLGSWDHGVTVHIAHAPWLKLRGRLTGIAKDGAMTGLVVPSEPGLVRQVQWQPYLKDGTMETQLEVTWGEKTARLVLVGSMKGRLEDGLGVEGSMVSLRRVHEGGHRSQYGEGARGDPNGDGWHLEVVTAKSTLWITARLDAVDSLVPSTLKEVCSLESLWLLALSQSDLEVQFSGALEGSGVVRLVRY
ncbi:MAG: hypothetical protein HN348_25420, partial [Proteobacteria bacterium]|nr:hypothetical protein [Pseudomonadota bacterium]